MYLTGYFCRSVYVEFLNFTHGKTAIQLKEFQLDISGISKVFFRVLATRECNQLYNKMLRIHLEATNEQFYHLSLVMRKLAFCICENKDAYQLLGDREADQRLCFRYTDCTIPLLPTSEISSP